MRGPIDYIIVGFDGNKFDGSILHALETAIDKGIIDLLALSIVNIDAKGVITEIDVANTGDDYMVEFSNQHIADNDYVNHDDIEEMGELLQNNTTAGLLVIEQIWAKPLKKALLDANGVLVAEGRIHPDAAEELNKVEEKSHAGVA